MTDAWKSRIVGEADLPPVLEWFPEDPKPEYEVKLAFAVEHGLTFRRVTFPNGDSTFFQIEKSK